MNKLIAGALVATAVLGGPSAEAAEANWRDVGRVDGFRTQAGGDTSRAFARKIAAVLINRNGCEGLPFWLKSPVTGKRYQLRCLGIQRPGHDPWCSGCGWTVPVWGGRGEHGSVIRARVWYRGQSN